MQYLRKAKIKFSLRQRLLIGEQCKMTTEKVGDGSTLTGNKADGTLVFGRRQ